MGGRCRVQRRVSGLTARLFPKVAGKTAESVETVPRYSDSRSEGKRLPIKGTRHGGRDVTGTAARPEIEQRLTALADELTLQANVMWAAAP